MGLLSIFEKKSKLRKLIDGMDERSFQEHTRQHEMKTSFHPLLPPLFYFTPGSLQ